MEQLAWRTGQSLARPHVAAYYKLNHPKQVVLLGDCILSNSTALLDVVANHFDEFINAHGPAALKDPPVLGNSEEYGNLFEFETGFEPRENVLRDMLLSQLKLSCVLCFPLCPLGGIR